MTPDWDWSRVMARLKGRERVSAIVVSYRTGPVLFDCLNVLIATPDIYEIVLVDNGNPPDVLARLQETAARAGSRLVITGGGVNRGFGAGVNLGVEASAGDRLLILNPDALLRPGSIAMLEAARQGHAEPAIVGGRIHGPDGAEQRGARRRRLTLASAIRSFTGLKALEALGPAFADFNMDREPAPGRPVSVGAVSGALMYLSRAAFETLGGFDERYFLHVEDIDLCRRAELAGGSVTYTPLAGAWHAGQTSDERSEVVERHKAAGFRRYFLKFANGPIEKAAAAMAGPLLTLAILARSASSAGKGRRS
jgi:N-acetylglucosaminyl-diphospho-decaprenol L-rhamnosyltransferase